MMPQDDRTHTVPATRCVEGPRLPPHGLCVPVDGSYWGKSYTAWHAFARWALSSSDGGVTRCVDVDVESCTARAQETSTDAAASGRTGEER